jgi:hypothetical protein
MVMEKEEEAALGLVEARVEDVSLAAIVEREISLRSLLVLDARVLASNAVFVGSDMWEIAPGREELWETLGSVKVKGAVGVCEDGVIIVDTLSVAIDWKLESTWGLMDVLLADVVADIMIDVPRAGVPDAICWLGFTRLDVKIWSWLLVIVTAEFVVPVVITSARSIVVDAVVRPTSEDTLGELRAMLLVPTVEVSWDIEIILVGVIEVAYEVRIVGLGVLETSSGKDLTRLVLLYGAMPLDTTCATLFATKIAAATFIRSTPLPEFLLLTNVHDPFWNVKPVQSLVSEHISEQDAKSLVVKFEVILLLNGKNVLQRIS